MQFGLMLSNRGEVLGYGDAAGTIELGVRAEESGRFDSVWSGDAFLANPRLDAILLLACVAARTERVQLGPACMGSFTQRGLLDLAYSWASLDRIARGRSLMVACVGGGSAEAWDREGRATGVAPGERRDRMWERIRVLRRLWSEDSVDFEGCFHRLESVTIEPKPLRQPYPVWAATNLTRLASGTAEAPLPMKTLARLGQECDGWMTHSIEPETFNRAWDRITASAEAAGRDPSTLDNALCFNICVGEDSDAAFAEASAFLRDYYGIAFPPERTRAWTAWGPPEACAVRLRRFQGSSVRRIALRICSPDQSGQFERIANEVLPLV